MSLSFSLPEEFDTVIRNKLVEIYSEAMEEAKRDACVTKEYLTLPEAMEYYNCGRATITSWTEQGVPLYRVGGKNYVKKSEINKFIASHQI